MLPQGPEWSQSDEREVLVTLTDGRVLEGRLIRYTDHLAINGERFYEHEIEELEEVE